MTNQSRVRLLEVEVTQLEPERWEWRVCEGDAPVMIGFSSSRETAQMAGDNALFVLLSVGFK
jgi:hypothetical protein